ncbi:MAG: chromate transporter [Chitinophagales bacterium]
MIWQLLVSFLKVGFFAYGGGYAMLPLLRHELITYRGWITPRQFLDVVALSQFTPGPIATSSAAFVGFRQAGVWGALAAFLAVILPSVAIVWTLALIVRHQADAAWLKRVFAGLRPAVVALVVYAAVSLAGSAVPDLKSLLIAVGTLVAVGVLRVHPFLAIVGAGLLGILLF